MKDFGSFVCRPLENLVSKRRAVLELIIASDRCLQYRGLPRNEFEKFCTPMGELEDGKTKDAGKLGEEFSVSFTFWNQVE